MSTGTVLRTSLTPYLSALARSDFAVTVMSRLGAQALFLLAVLVLGRYVSLATFGAFSLGWVALNIVSLLLYQGLYQVLLLLPEDDREADTIFWLMTALAVVASALMVGISGGASGSSAAIGSVFLLFAPLPVVIAFAAWLEAVLVRAGKLRATGVLAFLAELAGVFALVVGLEHTNEWAALVIWRYVSTLGYPLLTLLVARTLPRLSFSGRAARGAAQRSASLYTSVGSQITSSYGGDIVLGLFLPPAAVGAFRAGTRLVSAATDVLVRPLKSISWSRTARATREGDLHALGRMWVADVRFAAFLMLPMAAILFELGPAFVVEFVSREWAAAGEVVSVLALASGFLVFDTFFDQALVARGQARAVTLVRSGSAFLLLALLIFCARWGAVGAAAAYLGWRAASAGVMLVLCVRALSISKRQLAGALLPALALALCCALIGEVLHSGMGRRPLIYAAMASLSLWGLIVAALIGTRRLPLPRAQ